MRSVFTSFSVFLLFEVISPGAWLVSQKRNPVFIEVASKVGITAPNVFGGIERKRYLLETTGCGVAFIDYDRDGYTDLFFVNGTRLEKQPGAPEPLSHLYKNDGKGSFIDVTNKAGLSRSGWGQGVCAADYDNDGYDDLFVTYYGKNALYHNEGNGSFKELAEKAGVGGTEGRWNTGCTFVDYDRDGYVDLFVANYVDLGANLAQLPLPGAGQFCQYKGVPLACGPRGLLKAVNYLYRNNGNGIFTEKSLSSGIRQTEGYYALGVLSLDYNNDGWPDIYVACDSAPSILYRNNQNGSFSDVGFPSGTSFNEDGESQAGMGVAAADYDHDGHLDLVKTNFSDDSPNLYHNNADGTFFDRVHYAGMGRQRSYLGWGVLFFDFDNDGWKDIFMVNGHVAPEIDAAQIDTQFKQKKLLYRNLRNRTFEDISSRSGPALLQLRSSRGAAAADLWNDGRLAVAVNEMNDLPSLLVLDAATSNHWIGVRLVGVRSNRSGIGARVEIQTDDLRQLDEVGSGGGYLSQNDLRLHFGLGSSKTIDRLIVRWPSGIVDPLEDIPPDQHIVIEEGSSKWKRAEKRGNGLK